MALQDKIGREEIVNKICGLVDSLQKDQNFCLSINGAWGSGKSFVLQMIEEKLSKTKEYVIVKYDAWNNSFYSDPLIAILSCIIDGVDEKLDIVEQYETKLKKSAKTGVNVLAKISSKIAKLQEVIKGLKEVISTFHNPIDTEKFGDFKSYQKLLQETKEVLNEITQKGEYREKQSKLIVLVDEIDRCLPDEQLKILERLHHLFDVKNCAVIVAMNQDCIAKTVNTIYGIDGYEYLRKFFDFTYRLETSAGAYLKNLFDDFAKKFEKLQRPANEQAYPITLAYQCLLYGNNKVLDKVDNRELSRYYESLLNLCNDFGWEKLSQQYVFFVVLGLFIRKNISATFLSEKEIWDNQEHISRGDIQREVLNYPERDGMPYFDYLVEYLGMDRENLPEVLVRKYGWNHCHIPELSWSFNEIVYFSLGKEFPYNEMRVFYHQPTVISSDCQELRRLIILYGGEQQNATNER